jgi:thioredoxin-like negative regulator of GroEL
VGRAFVLMNRGRFPESTQLLKAVLAKNPESELALCFLGAALRLSGHNQAANDAFAQLADAGQNAAAVELANALTQNPA